MGALPACPRCRGNLFLVADDPRVYECLQCTRRQAACPLLRCPGLVVDHRCSACGWTDDYARLGVFEVRPERPDGKRE